MNIKLIVFDIDGTFYPLKYVQRKNYDNAKRFLSKKLNKTEKETELLFAQNSIFPYQTPTNRSITAFVLSQGVSLEEWNSYRNRNFSFTQIPLSECVRPQDFSALYDKYVLVTLSSNTIRSVKIVLQTLQLEHFFSDVFCIDQTPFDNNTEFSKKEIIKYASEKYHVPLSSVLSVGDRFNTDIVPVLELGGVGLLVSKPSAISLISPLLDGELSSSEELKIFYKGDPEQ